MKMDAGIDTGDILLKESLVIREEDNAGALSERLSRLGADLLVRTLDGLLDGTVVGTPQDDSLSSYTKKIKKTDGEIDWSLDASVVAQKVRAMTPWPSAYTFCRGRRLIIVDAEEASGASDEAATTGSVLSLDPLTIACGRGALVIRRLKPEGRKVMSVESYLAGNPLEVGERLE
jgi:methionyl-tRNA formyltransferase